MKGHIMPRVRANGAQRWASRTAAATPDYQAGVASPRQPWQSATVAAAPAHKAATMEALAQDRFAKGVARVGNEKWQRAAQGKGAERFGPGAAAGVEDYQQGVAPYLQVIESTQLPPRGPKGDPRNIQRVAVLAAALRKRKTGSASVATLALVAFVAIALALVASVGRVRGSAPQTPRDGAGKLISGLWARHLVSGDAYWRDVAGWELRKQPGPALDIITASVTAAAAGGSAMAAVAGDSLIVRNASLDQRPLLMATWVKSQTSGFYQWIHPAGHDQVRDLRFREVLATPLNLLPYGIAEFLEPQELMALTLSGAAVAGDIEIATMMVYYPTLPGIESRLIDLPTLENRMRRLVTIEDTTTSTVDNAYSGARLLTAGSDLLKANTDYAIMGAHIGVTCGVLTIRGSDTGNLRVGIPGMAGRPDITGEWFMDMAEAFNLPLIPVINSANKGNITIENVQDENRAAVPFSLMMAELTPG